MLREIHLAVQLDEQKRWAGRRETVLRTLRSMPDFSAAPRVEEGPGLVAAPSADLLLETFPAQVLAKLAAVGAQTRDVYSETRG